MRSSKNPEIPTNPTSWSWVDFLNNEQQYVVCVRDIYRFHGSYMFISIQSCQASHSSQQSEHRRLLCKNKVRAELLPDLGICGVCVLHILGYIYISIYIYIIYTYIFCKYVWIYICIYVYMCICIYVNMCIYIYCIMYICIYVNCIYVYMYVCVYVYMYICKCINK